MDIKKFINCVRQHPIVYDTNNDDYKNVALKALAWERIAEEMNQTCDVVKQKWKTLRDGYHKNKKLLLQGSTTTSGRIVTNYVWSDLLRFLDDYNGNRKSRNKVRRRSDSISSETVQSEDESQEYAQPDHLTSLQTQPPDYYFKQEQDFPATSQYLTLSTESTPLQIPQANRDLDRILQHLKDTPKKDAVDHLFQSYAETFKKLSPIVQAQLKVDLAKLFAEAELKEILNTSNSSTTNSNISNMNEKLSLLK